MMLTETLTFGDKVMTTIALAIVLAAIITAAWMMVYVVWSVLDWVANKFKR